MIASDLRSGVEQLGDMIAEASDHRSLYRRRHLDRMRHSRFPLARRIVDPQPADPVRRIRRQPGGPRRGMAAALCDGADVCRGQAGARPPRAGVALQGRQDSGHHHPEHRQSASGLGLRRPITWSNCTATPPMPAASAAGRPTIWPGSSSASTKPAARPTAPICDEPVKTATISFGQAMPEDAMRRATELAQHCDLFLAIGSSLVVWPAAGFPHAGQEQRRQAGDHQQRADRTGRHRRSGDPARHRGNAWAVRRQLMPN